MTPVFAGKLEHAEQDASLAPGQWPLILFSPGLCANPQTYSLICMDMASYGSIVAGVEHTDGSSVTAYVGKDRRYIPFNKYSSATHGPSWPFYNRMLEVRLDDFDSVLAALRSAARDGGTSLESQAAHPSPSAPNLIDSIDFENITVAGHSFVFFLLMFLVALVTPARPYNVVRSLYSNLARS